MSAPDWLSSSADELAANVDTGMKISIGADYSGIAMELTRAIIRRGVRDLHVICMPVSGLQADLLIGAGCVKTIETSGITFGEYGTPYRFHQALRDGSIQVLDATCPAIHAALEAGRKDIPFIPLRGIIGSDVLTHRPDWKVVENPFSAGDRIVLLPAIRPDYAIFHAPWADRSGNVYVGRRREVVNMSQASRHGALVTVEEIRDVDLMASEESAAGTMPSLFVNSIAVAPKGAWPIGLWDCYEADEGHFKTYADKARSLEGFRNYLDEFVLARDMHRAPRSLEPVLE
jgi:glutaconate CoA-transferase subunit A